MQLKDLKQNVLVRGPLFPELIQVLVVTPMGSSVKVIATCHLVLDLGIFNAIYMI